MTLPPDPLTPPDWFRDWPSHRLPFRSRRRALLALAVIAAAAFMAGVLADRAVLAASRSAADIPAVPLSVAGASEPVRLPSGTPRVPGSGSGVPSSPPTVAARPSPTPDRMAGASVSGVASWYDAGPGLYAAAGPALRVGSWRGRIVTVCATACVRVRLVDFCGCLGTRLIDLSPEAFAALAPLSRGLLEVSVRW